MTPRRAPDRRALALAIVVHAALLALLLTAHDRQPLRPDMPALTVFDVPPPPPPPPPVVVPKPPLPRPPSRKPAGGSPAPPPPPPERVDTTPLPVAPPAPPAVASPFAADGVPAQLAGAGEGAAGTGQGAGSGRGRGDGIGPGDGGVRYAKAEWIRMPPPDAMRAFWPNEAIRRRVSGRVELGCYVPRPGIPRRCWLLSETPKGFGFGKAAMALWGQFRIRPVRRNGEPLDVPVIVPIAYDVPATPPLRK